MAEEFDFNALLSKLQNDSESKSGNRLKKLVMNTPDNLGATITCLPILMKGEIYQKLDSVRELKTTSKFFKDGEQDTWCRLFDKSVYGELTKEESDLWKVTKDNLESLIDVSGDFYLCRFRRYTLIPVHILKFIAANGVENPDMVGTALLIFPSHSVIKSLRDAIATMSANMNGNQWMPLVFSPKTMGREGALNIKFSKSTSSKGYDAFVSIMMNTQWSPIVDPKKDYSEGEDFDPIKEFLSWQVDGDKLFNAEYVKELNEHTLELIKEFESTENPEAPQESSEASVGPATPTADPSTVFAGTPVEPAATQAAPAQSNNAPF